MPDVIRTLNKAKYGLSIRRTIFEQPTYWVTRFRIGVVPGDLLFLAWDKRVRAVAPIERLWTPRKADKANWQDREKWPKGYYAVTVGPFKRIRIPFEWHGHVGWRYVHNLDSWAGYDYCVLQDALFNAAERYCSSIEGAAEIERILRRAAARKRARKARIRARKAAEDAARERALRAEERRFRRATKNALWRQPEERRAISKEDREKYF